MKNYYALLGVESNATKGEIKKNFRQLATKFHPDKTSDPGSAEKFIEISEAYEVLSNKKSRAQYDLLRWHQLKKQQESGGDYFTSAVATAESTRTRRNKSQEKRSINYRETNGEAIKLFPLVVESFYVVSRYILHILGVTILLVMLNAVAGQLFSEIERNLIRGLVVGLFAVGIIYGIFWTLSNLLSEFKKDLEAFSIFYKIPQNRIAPILLSVFTFVLLIYGVFLFWCSSS